MTRRICNTLCQKFGKDRRGHQRYRCYQYSKMFTGLHNGNFPGMYTPPDNAAAIIKLLVEGVSVRSIERLTDTADRDIILRVLVNAGERCEQLLEDRIREVSVKDFNVMKCGGLVGCKQKRNTDDHSGASGIG